MSNKVYIGDVGTEIIVNCGQDISSATVHSLEVKKPNGKEVSWSAEIYNSNYLKYVIVENDLDQYGLYELQSKLTIGTWSGKGETTQFTVYPLFK